MTTKRYNRGDRDEGGGALPRMVDVVPHRPPMLLLDDVVAWDKARVECRVVIRDDSPFAVGGRVAPTLAIEYMAQCVAAYVGLEAYERGDPITIGYLVGAREISFDADAFWVGDELRVEAVPVWAGETVGSFLCKIDRAGAQVASGALNVYRGKVRELGRS